ncbi:MULTISPECIES: nitroreductase family deazaflavin-dependent oxidoreductase [unclassified Agromyces]|uniref:nitroreductase family deazaflavin-dependent oxidoreductase n=1 Tax=unclassified Agromyces TaxID=2639701 RepID=UPI0030153326
MVTRKPPRIVIWLNRAPVALYRARLGGLLGGRFLMLTAIGRTSGLARRTVLEVVQRGEGSPPTLWVLAARGRRTDWYRNALANPHVDVHWRSRRFSATAHPLDEPERTRRLAEYRRRHPRTARLLGSTAVGVPFTGQDDVLQKLAHELRMLRLEPDSPDVAAPR